MTKLVRVPVSQLKEVALNRLTQQVQAKCFRCHDFSFFKTPSSSFRSEKKINKIFTRNWPISLVENQKTLKLRIGRMKSSGLQTYISN